MPFLKKISCILSLTIILTVLCNYFIAPSCYDAVRNQIISVLKGAKAEVAKGTLRVIADESFLNSFSEEYRKKIIDELTTELPNFTVLDKLSYFEFTQNFRVQGTSVDTLEIIADAENNFGVPTISIGERFYSTTGKGYGNHNTISYWWFLGNLGYRHEHMRGRAYKGVSHLDPYRLLPSNPDYIPIGGK